MENQVVHEAVYEASSLYEALGAIDVTSSVEEHILLNGRGSCKGARIGVLGNLLIAVVPLDEVCGTSSSGKSNMHAAVSVSKVKWPNAAKPQSINILVYEGKN